MPRPLPIEAQRADRPAQPLDDAFPAVAELISPDNGSYAEFALADQRLWVDNEPRLAGGSQYIVIMKVLIEAVQLGSVTTGCLAQRRIGETDAGYRTQRDPR